MHIMWCGNVLYGYGTRWSCIFLLTVSPFVSLMSASCINNIPNLGIFQLNQYKRLERTYWAEASPNDIVGHPFLPILNEINWKSCPLKSTWLVSNLLGMNSPGSSHNLVSLWIVDALINTIILVVVWYPLSLTLDDVSQATKRGTGGCNLKVSLTTHFK